MVVTPQGQPVTINNPDDVLSSITSHLSVGVKLFPSHLPETLRDSLFESAEQSLGSTEDTIPQQLLGGLPVEGFDKDVAGDLLAQVEAVLVGFAVEKQTNQIFLESRTIFLEDSTAGAFLATAGDVEPSLSLPPQVGQYACLLYTSPSPRD